MLRPIERLPLLKGMITTIRSCRRLETPGWKYNPKSGLFEKRYRNRNMVVLAGLSMMAKSIQYGHADQQKTLRYMGLGSGYTYPSKSDTALVSEEERAEIDSWDNTGIASDPVVMIASRLFLAAQANADLMEAGLFQESAGAPMFCRGLLGYGLIGGATQADPCVVTTESAHGLSDGDKIYIEGVAGMTELNDNAYFIDVLNATSFGLYTDSALTTSVDSSGYGAYSEASPDADTWKLIIPKTASETLTVIYSITFPAD